MINVILMLHCYAADDDKRQRLISWLATAKNKELRATFKLNDRDLNYHAGRVYLLGTNCPILHAGEYM